MLLILKGFPPEQQLMIWLLFYENPPSHQNIVVYLIRVYTFELRFLVLLHFHEIKISSPFADGYVFVVSSTTVGLSAVENLLACLKTSYLSLTL